MKKLLLVLLLAASACTFAAPVKSIDNSGITKEPRPQSVVVTRFVVPRELPRYIATLIGKESLSADDDVAIIIELAAGDPVYLANAYPIVYAAELGDWIPDITEGDSLRIGSILEMIQYAKTRDFTRPWEEYMGEDWMPFYRSAGWQSEESQVVFIPIQGRGTSRTFEEGPGVEPNLYITPPRILGRVARKS